MDSPQAIVTFYAGASFDPALVTGVLMEGASFALLLVILAKVADLFGGVDGGSRWVGWLIVGGAGLEMSFGILGYPAILMAGVFAADHGGLSNAGYFVLHDVRFAFCWLDLVALLLWMVPLGFAVIGTRIFPRWLAWAWIANAVVLPPALYLPVDIWDPVSGVPLVLILIMSVLMILRPERYSSGAVSLGTPVAVASGANREPWVDADGPTDQLTCPTHASLAAHATHAAHVAGLVRPRPKRKPTGDVGRLAYEVVAAAGAKAPGEAS